MTESSICNEKTYCFLVQRLGERGSIRLRMCNASATTPRNPSTTNQRCVYGQFGVHPRMTTPSYICNMTTPANQPQHDSYSLRHASPQLKGRIVWSAALRLPSA